MELLHKYLFEFSGYLVENKIKVHVIGQMERLPPLTQTLLQGIGYKGKGKGKGKGDEGRNLCLAISYGGRMDIVESCRQITQEFQQGKINSTTEIDESLFHKHTALGALGLPDPDLIIRTSGEFRLSNFLLWQAAYAELACIDCLWPEFTTEKCGEVINQYSMRKRRFGGVGITDDIG